MMIGVGEMKHVWYYLNEMDVVKEIKRMKDNKENQEIMALNKEIIKFLQQNPVHYEKDCLLGYIKYTVAPLYFVRELMADDTIYKNVIMPHQKDVAKVLKEEREWQERAVERRTKVLDLLEEVTFSYVTKEGKRSLLNDKIDAALITGNHEELKILSETLKEEML
jgi:hypothetical protein